MTDFIEPMHFQHIYISVLLGWGLLASQLTLAGTAGADSLLYALRTTHTDTGKLNLLNRLAWEYRKINTDTSIQLENQALDLAMRLPGTPGEPPSAAYEGKKQKLIRSNYQLAVFLRMKHEQDLYRPSISYLTQALLLADSHTPAFLRCEIVHELGKNYYFLHDYGHAKEYENLALQLARAGSNKEQTADILMLSGVLYSKSGAPAESDKALLFYSDALKLLEDLKDTLRISTAYGNIASVYGNRGDYLRDLEMSFKVLNIKEKIKDKTSLVMVLHNIALTEIKLHNNAKAQDYAYRALNTSLEMGNKDEICLILVLLASIFSEEGNSNIALAYSSWALNLGIATDNKDIIQQAYDGLGDVCKKQGDSAWAKGDYAYALNTKYPLALGYIDKSLKLARETADDYSKSLLLGSMGLIQLRQGQVQEAEKNMLESLACANITDRPEPQQAIHEQLSELYLKKGEFQKAYEHLRKFIAVRDTLSSKDKSIQASNKTMAYEYDKKAAQVQAEHDKKELISSGEKIRQRIIMGALSLILLLFMGLALFINYTGQQKQKMNHLLKQRNTIIQRQKELVEAKNKNIEASINYARRIQEAILPAPLFEPAEVSCYFIYFLPKDIVSGDFYWRFKDGDDLFLAVVDCTGHGVPGAMMSMLGYDLLEFAVKDKGLREPSLILQAMNEQLMQKLIKGNPGISTDGMDMTLCKLNRKTETLTYAGAKNELCIAHHTDMKRYQVDKRSVGYEAGFMFTQQTLTINPGETIYLYTDGYADQKGGPENRKYMGARFRTFLQGISGLACAEQQQALQNEFLSWKNKIMQRDDVLVVGFKL